MKIKSFVVLDSIRKTCKTLEYPVTERWAPLKEEIDTLEEQGWLEVQGNKYLITKDGKKAALLFKVERDRILSQYGEQVLAEAGLKIRGRMSDEDALDYLTTLNMFLIWEEFFDIIKRLESTAVNWQSFILDSFEQYAHKGVTLKSWKELKATTKITRT